MAENLLSQNIAIHITHRLNALEESGDYPEVVPLSQAIQLEQHRIDWDTLGRRRVAAGMLGSIAASMHMAHIEAGAGAEYFTYFDIEDVDTWRNIIDTTLTDDGLRAGFYKHLGRQVVTAALDRGVPSYYILAEHQARIGRNLIGLDIGAGPHIIAPAIDSGIYAAASFPGREHLSLRPEVDIDLAVGLDIQDTRTDTDWLKASVWPAKTLKDDYRAIAALRHTHDNDRFPFIQGDIMDGEVVRNIKDIVKEQYGFNGVDFLVTAFVRHLLPFEGHIENVAHQLLNPQGVWISLGEERARRAGGHISKRTVAAVRQMKGYTFSGTPLYEAAEVFELRSQRRIVSMDLDYFHALRKEVVNDI